MYREELTKPDGRLLTVYSARPIGIIGVARSPRPPGALPNPHLRWHPLRGTWVAYASHRQDRTFLPPPEYNPLLPSDDPNNPTELPTGDYDVAVFDNLFPALAPGAHDAPGLAVDTMPGTGKCEVVVFTQDPHTSLGQLPLAHVELLIDVWGERTELLGREPAIRYVLPFENRGVEVGVTLHHPHGQIYAYPFVPPIPQKMNELETEHLRKTGAPLLQGMIENELRDGVRVIYEGAHAVAFVPICAQYPYEVWIAPRVAVPNLMALSADQRADVARALKTTLLKYDGLWQRPLPYIMAWYQAPTDGRPHPESHVHAQFYPPYRTREKLKYLAGTEIAAGMFASDVLPEAKARELRDVAVTV
jgi:UDPglucose--hexose-1-phosphate uridylyltransferase